MQNIIQDYTFYNRDDFKLAPKYDAHIHYHTFYPDVLRYAKDYNMRFLTINTDLNMPIDKQLEIARSLKMKYPEMIDFLGTFNAADFVSESFAQKTIVRIKKCMDAGAKGIKIWKNIGMVLRDGNDRYVMADDPVFDPVFAYLEKERIPLLAHLGEPYNCWLPYDEITTIVDLHYFQNHPKYHMYLHPEVPSYERQMAARDHLLERYPRLRFVGAHISSLESNIDEVAFRFDRHPEFYIDLTARMSHIQLQTLHNRGKVFDFFVKYQDRIIFGTDYIIKQGTGFHNRLFPRINMFRLSKAMIRLYKYHWLFLATDQIIDAEKFNFSNCPKTIKGLQLPRKIIDKVFYENAIKVYQ